jgi:hypothetical protein
MNIKIHITTGIFFSLVCLVFIVAQSSGFSSGVTQGPSQYGSSYTGAFPNSVGAGANSQGFGGQLSSQNSGGQVIGGLGGGQQFSSLGSSSLSGGSFGNSYTGTFGGRTYSPSVNTQFTNPSFFSGSGFSSPDVYWPRFNQDDCRDRQDFIMQIAPGGCSPAVVRSDLLEEQNVPVFCKIMSLQVNPLIDVSYIRSLRFTGQYPRGISGVSYFPANAALRSQYNLVSSPVNDNLGYLVIVVSREEIEGDMPDFIEGNITAVIDYDAQGAFGVGRANFYASELTDSEWQRTYQQYGFWNGKGYIRAEVVEPNRATISIYRDVDTVQSTITLTTGETSQDIHLGGFYCSAGMQIRLDRIAAPVTSALLQISHRNSVQQHWVAQGDRILDGRCRVDSLDAYAGGGKIGISCPVQNGRFELALSPGRVDLEKDGTAQSYSLGQRIEANLFVGYVGLDKKDTPFVVLVRDTFSVSENGFLDKGIQPIIEGVVQRNAEGIDSLQEKIETAVYQQYRTRVRNTALSSIEGKVSITLLQKDTTGKFGYTMKNVFVAQNVDYGLLESEAQVAKEYYDLSSKAYQDLVDFYPQERFIEAEEPYAVRGLGEAADMAKRFNLSEDSLEFYDQIIQNYPLSESARRAEIEKQNLIRYDSAQSKASVHINNDQYFIDVLQFKQPALEEVNAVLLINGQEVELGLNRVHDIGDRTSQGSIQLKNVHADYVEIVHYSNQFNRLSTFSTSGITRRLTLRDNAEQVFDGTIVKLLKINVNNQAKVSINPKAFGPRTESSFTFKIGIEKRGIQLSPERTEETITNLQETIEQWDDVNTKLGSVVKGMKAACFATSGVLTLKNLVAGFTGKSVARSRLMRGTNGWNEFCQEEVNKKIFTSIDNCLRENNAAIEKDVALLSDQVQQKNEILENIQKNHKKDNTDIFDLQGEVDAQGVEKDFKKEFDSFLANNGGSITLPDKDGTLVTISDMKDWEGLTHEQRREIMTLQGVRLSGGSVVLQNYVHSELGKVTLQAKNYQDFVVAEDLAQKEITDYGILSTRLAGDGVTAAHIGIVKKGDSISQKIQGLTTGARYASIFIPSRVLGDEGYSADSAIADKNAIVTLALDKNSGKYTVDKVYTASGQESEGITASVKEYLALRNAHTFVEAENAYENPLRNPGGIRVEYFERAPYKGRPALVPFDVRSGWYVKMTYVLSGFGKPYDESGRAINYYICNAGQNGIIEFQKQLDDICRYYNSQTGASLGFAGLTPGEEQQLIIRAQQAITEAARQHGQERVTINGQPFGSGISFGGEDGRCSDFMSPADCHLMFNVCDPVICPSSRCDLGGKYRVDNVIQTGVIGSLLLCLPNAQEGIFAPICLSGVHAGIDGYVNILKSTEACLQESLETGKNIGICDEVQSVYMCQFFWEQATPFMNVLIPRVIESFFSQGIRGGGEYLTVQGAWDNLQDSISYFRDEYAVNSVQAFTARSTGQIGSEVCKSFVSTSYPASKDFFNNLIEPDSPTQYTAWFNEDILTTATIPSTSHYKVYFHIYGGKDQGVQYVVYLRDLPESNVVHSSQTYVVDRGYIARGSQVDKARDFTAVSGYPQLCVSINGQEECGFGKISSSYFLNTLSEQYAADQINQSISQASSCVAGTPSLQSLSQPNIQFGAQEILDPALYNKGIVRVCATRNPGQQVDSTGQLDTTNSVFDRWKDVGYCDDQTIRCWLDTDSVKDVIRNTELEKQVLDQVNVQAFGVQGILSETESAEIGTTAYSEIEQLGSSIKPTDSKSDIENKIAPTINRLNTLINTGYPNVHRAHGQFLLANIYRRVAEILISRTTLASIKPPLSSKDNVASPSDVSVIDKNVDTGDGVETREGSTSLNPSTVELGTEDADSLDVPISESVISEPYARGLSFLLQDGRYWTQDISYMYDVEQGWLYFVPGSASFSVNVAGPAFESLNEDNRIFIESLRDVGYREGIVSLSRRIREDDEGGWWDPALIISFEGSQLEFGPSHHALFDSSILFEDISQLLGSEALDIS